MLLLLDQALFTFFYLLIIFFFFSFFFYLFYNEIPLSDFFFPQKKEEVSCGLLGNRLGLPIFCPIIGPQSIKYIKCLTKITYLKAVVVQ